MGAKTVPGQMGQPEKSDLMGPSFQTIDWSSTSTPRIDYYERDHGNPLQETTPMKSDVEHNDSKENALGRTTNDINGGGDMFKTKGHVKEAP